MEREKHYLCTVGNDNGELAQLARAFEWHSKGHRFDSGILHCFAESEISGMENRTYGVVPFRTTP